jgi:hypothetical protein
MKVRIAASLSSREERARFIESDILTDDFEGGPSVFAAFPRVFVVALGIDMVDHSGASVPDLNRVPRRAAL